MTLRRRSSDWPSLKENKQRTETFYSKYDTGRCCQDTTVQFHKRVQQFDFIGFDTPCIMSKHSSFVSYDTILFLRIGAFNVLHKRMGSNSYKNFCVVWYWRCPQWRAITIHDSQEAWEHFYCFSKQFVSLVQTMTWLQHKNIFNDIVTAYMMKFSTLYKRKSECRESWINSDFSVREQIKTLLNYLR